VNSEPTAFISDFSTGDFIIDMEMYVDSGTGDDDFIGFIFAYTDPNHYYIFDWKKADQYVSGSGTALHGMAISRVDGSAQNAWDHSGDFVELARNSDVRADAHVYKVTVEFIDGEIAIWVDNILKLQVYDPTYAGGKIGFYNYSQPDTHYRITNIDDDRELRGRWKMNSSYGITVYDSSFKNNNGAKALPKQPQWVESTIADQFENYEIDGYALSFDGTSSNSVTVPDSLSLNISDVITVEAWLRPQTSQVARATVIDQGFSTTTKTGWQFQYDDAGQQLCFRLGAANTISTPLCTSSTINNQRWHHVMAIYDGKTIALYYDGNFQGSQAWTKGIGITSGGALYFGKPFESGGLYKGELDEVAIYQYPFNDWEALVAYEDWSYGLVGRWQFDSASSNTVSDMSNQNNQANLINGATLEASDLDDSQKGADTANQLALNGTNQYASIADSATLHFGVMTAEAWIKPSNQSQRRSIIAKDNEWILSISSSNTLQVALSNGGYTSYYGTATVPMAVWSHVAFSWDAEYLRIYLNGELKNTYGLPNGWMKPGTAPIALGARLDSGNTPADFYAGKIENVSLWNSTRDVEEIMARAAWIARTGWPVPQIKEPLNEDSQIVNAAVKFDASTSYDPAGINKRIAYYYWDFHDGQPVQTTNAVYYYTFTTTGIKPIYLVVEDGDGNIEGTLVNVEVKSSLTMSDYSKNAQHKIQSYRSSQVSK
jgi:hypothetical protein